MTEEQRLLLVSPKEAGIVAAPVAAQPDHRGSRKRRRADSGSVYGTEGLRFES
jgi:hypothetical protein